jgi:hypothetical protein
VKIRVLLTTAAMLAMVATAANATTNTVLNTDLSPISPGTTTTTGTGTKSTNTASSTLGGELGADQWIQNNVRGNGVVGITTDYAHSGNGSIYFSTDGSSPSKADMEYYFSQPLLLSDFSGGSYDWLRDPAGANPSTAIAPSYRLIVSTAGGAFGNLVYEPYNQPGGQPVTQGSWQTTTIDTLTSLFWATGNNFTIPSPGGVGPSCQSCLHDLSDWSSSNAGAKVLGFSTGVGSGWSGGPFVGAVDNIGFSFGENTQIYNFEVAGGAVPEPTTWAMMIAGFGLAGAALRRRRAAIAA